MTMLCGLPILAARFGFIRGHCGKVANKAPPGSCNRCIGASRDPSSIVGQSICPFSTSGSAIRSVHSRRQSPVLNPEPRARRLPLAIVLSCSFFTNRRIVLPTSTEVFHHTQSTPVLGHVGLRWVVPVPGIPALPLTRHCQVVWGLCPMTVPHPRTCQLWLSGGQKH